MHRTAFFYTVARVCLYDFRALFGSSCCVMPLRSCLHHLIEKTRSGSNKKSSNAVVNVTGDTSEPGTISGTLHLTDSANGVVITGRIRGLKINQEVGGDKTEFNIWWHRMVGSVGPPVGSFKPPILGPFSA